MSTALSKTLAVVIPRRQIGTDHPSQALQSAHALRPCSLLTEIKIIEIPDHVSDPADQRNEAIAQATQLGASWVLFLEPDERLQPDALTHLMPAVAAYDGLWGGIFLSDEQGQTKIAKQSQISSGDVVRNYHTALHWWIGKSHFVRTEVAARVGFDSGKGEAWYADYLTRMWATARCLKSAQPLTSRTGALPELSPPNRDFLLNALSQHPQFICFNHHSHKIQLPYTGRNPTLERVQLRGVFYEQSDLETLATYVKPGAVCVDVGANTGNHTVFFAKLLGAAKVISIEPNPDTVAVLQRVIIKNQLSNVDTSKLGIGVGRQSGKFDLTVGRRGYLGTARLTPNRSGEISVQPLDTLINEPIGLLKIDVEMMEIDVLEGARHVIGDSRPVLLIEAQDENITALLAILDELSYRIEKIFPDQGYANYLALPTAEA